MKYFAAITSNNIVTRIVVAGDDDSQPMCSLVEGETSWVETKKDGSIRKNWAQVECEYKPTEDVFCGLKDYPSWVLDTTTYVYDSPIGRPADDNNHVEIDGVLTQLTSRKWEEDNQIWTGTIASSVAGQEETHLDKYIWNHLNQSWTFDSTIERS